MKDHEESSPLDILVREDDTLDGGAILRLLDKPLSGDDLKEATERVARPLELAQQDTVRLLVFRCGDELLAFESVEVHQVARAVDVHRIPHRSNKILRGLCNLDGELMLCADLAKLLELGEAKGAAEGQSDRCRMIVLGKPPDFWAMRVDAVYGVTVVVRESFRQPPITVDAAVARYTKHLVPLSQGLAILLDRQLVISGFQAVLR